MALLEEVLVWFNDPANWTGSRGVIHQTFEHVRMSGVAMAAAIVLAVPPAVWLGHKGRFGTLAMNLANVGRALPSFAILLIGTQIFGLLTLPVIGSFTTFIALTLLAIPPLLTNTYVALAEVDLDIKDSARGMGMNESQLLWQVELPLAVPLIMAGVRTAAIAVVATATIAAFVGTGGLGRFIVDGNASKQTSADELLAGGVLVALLAIATEVMLALVQLGLTPKGVRRAARAAEGPAPAVLPGATLEVAQP